MESGSQNLGIDPAIWVCYDPDHMKALGLANAKGIHADSYV